MININTYKTFKALAILLLGLFFFTPSFGQETKKIRILHADHLYKRPGDDDVNRLIGHVKYEHEGAKMQCDSSIYFRNENRFEAYGNVRINQGDTINLTGDKVTYSGASRLLHVTGNVFMSDGSMRLQTEEIIYDRAQNIAYYNGGGHLVQEGNTLKSKMGFYNTGSKRFTFRDSVVLNGPDYSISADTLQYGSQNKIAYFLGPTEIVSGESYIYCEKGQYDTENDIAQLTKNALITKNAQTIKGDSIFYQVKNGEGYVEGHAYLSDTINKYVITGGRVQYVEHPEWALVTDHPLYALKVDDDTLYITGDTLNVITDRFLERKVRVFRNTRFFKTDFQGKCDSLIYTESDSTFNLYHEPVVWNQENQLTADFIYMTTKQGNLDSLHMLGNAFMIGQEDSTKYNQIKGRNMYGKFYNNELRTIFVSGNGQTVYYAYDEDEKEIGVNRADCSDLIIRIEESKVDKVVFLVKPKSTLYPTGQIPKGELFLKGFRNRFNEQMQSKEDLIAR